MGTELNVLAISYGRNLFDAHNTERTRMELCAAAVNEYHMIVFTRRSDNISVTHAQDGLVLHPTNSRSRVHMLFDAVRIGASLLKNRTEQWVLTTQDPFEAGLVGYILSRRWNVKLNMQEHGDFFSTNAWRTESILNRIRFSLGKYLLRRADTIRVVSTRIQATMEHLGVSPEKIVHLAVRVTDDRERSDTSVDLHAQYPEASVIILSMARFVPQKNLLLLIKAFALFSEKNSSAKLVLIGAGPEEKKLHAAVKKHALGSSVVFKEWTNSPHAYIKSADIYALSSNYEGWARVLVEAMLAGTPVVTTDVGCAGEVVKDGVHGFVVPVGNVRLFADKLQLLADDESMRVAFALSSRQDVILTHASPDAYAIAWAEVLQETLNA